MMEEPREPDHYSVLEVEQTATERDIIRSFRKLSLKWHPDKNIGKNEEEALLMMKKVSDLELQHDLQFLNYLGYMDHEYIASFLLR